MLGDLWIHRYIGTKVDGRHDFRGRQKQVNGWGDCDNKIHVDLNYSDAITM